MTHPRVLFLTKYDRAGASSRYRTFQYLPWLEQAGIECEVAPLFDAEYLANRYASGQRYRRDLFRALGKRVSSLRRLGSFDAAVIEYEVLPYFPSFFEKWIIRSGIPYVVDYDDALFHQYDRHPNTLIRQLLGRKISDVMRGARLVIAGNEYIASYARQAGSRRIEILPTVIDLERYSDGIESGGRAEPFVIGWIGTPVTAKYLKEVEPALKAVCANSPVELRTVGSGALQLDGVPISVQPWKEETEVAEIKAFDVGIMPLPDTPWERGKCGLKLIQYMACGLPVIASPVGVNATLVTPSVNGYLADTPGAWVEAFQQLANDSALCRRLGENGRGRVERHYSLQSVAPRYVELINEVIGQNLCVA